jgi:aryl-alcohol dehydrogenase-like predicted oxidoreductase
VNDEPGDKAAAPTTAGTTQVPGTGTGRLEQRPFPRLAATGARHAAASVVGLGCWQLGADWGEVTEDDALAVLGAAVDSGVTFFDTADVYGDGRSEQFIGRFLRELGADADAITVATKIGRRADPFVPQSFTDGNLRAWVDRSRRNLGVDTLDLVQLHCPPTPTYSDDAVFDTLDALRAEGTLAGYGVSVETCAEALTAIARPGVVSVQIILNAFRLKPLDEVLPAAIAAGVSIIARVPLASGLLSGRYSSTTTFPADDHRHYNRSGAAFNVGETFSGVDFATGLAAVTELTAALPEGWSLPQAAVRWIIDQPGVTAVIPGARNPRQARDNAAAGRSAPVPAEFASAVATVYDELLRADIHPRW